MKKLARILSISLLSVAMTSGFAVAQEKKQENIAVKEEAKKLLSYSDFSKKHPNIKSFFKAGDVQFGQKLSSKKLQEMGYVLHIAEDNPQGENSKYDFYTYVKPNPNFLGVNVGGKNIIVSKETGKVSGVLIEYFEEKVMVDLRKAIEKDLGKPIDELQVNVDLITGWGMAEGEQKIVPTVLAFNIYTQEGSLIWSDPTVFFK